MLRLGAEMAGFSGGAVQFPELGLLQVAGFSAKELSHYICRICRGFFC
jgi:hypothetical protein